MNNNGYAIPLAALVAALLVGCGKPAEEPAAPMAEESAAGQPAEEAAPSEEAPAAEDTATTEEAPQEP